MNAERPVYRVTCSECGTVTEQAYEIDAQAILWRHVEVQGFKAKV